MAVGSKQSVCTGGQKIRDKCWAVPLGEPGLIWCEGVLSSLSRMTIVLLGIAFQVVNRCPSKSYDRGQSKCRLNVNVMDTAIPLFAASYLSFQTNDRGWPTCTLYSQITCVISFIIKKKKFFFNNLTNRWVDFVPYGCY